MNRIFLTILFVSFNCIKGNAQSYKSNSGVLNPYKLIEQGLIEVVEYHTKAGLKDIANELKNKYNFEIDGEIDEESISGEAILVGNSKNESCLLVTLDRIEEKYEGKIIKRDISVMYSWECD